MGIISLEHSDQLIWLGRYTQRVYETLKLFSDSYDIMIDTDFNHYKEFCMNLDIPNIYTSTEDFCKRYCFDQTDPNSIASNLTRAYDNAIVLREEIGSDTLSYIQLAIYDMDKALLSLAPLIELQKVMDDLMAFWGMVNEIMVNRNARNLMKTGKRIEKLSLYTRLHASQEEIKIEAYRLQRRIEQTKLAYHQEDIDQMIELTKSNPIDYVQLIKVVENLI